MPPVRRPASVVLLCLASALAGCSYGYGDDDDDYYYSEGPVSCGDAVERATIDTGELLDVEAGVGAGAFIEYEAGGTYRVTTACDADNGGDCYWDIVVRPLDGAPLIAAGPTDLEGEDSLGFSGDELRMVAFTGRDFDGFTLQTEPGAGLELDVLLDDACANRYLFWIGDGALRGGAPSNPIDLVPSEP